MKNPNQQTKSQAIHSSRRFNSCFDCDNCFSGKVAAEIGGPLYLGNIDKARILAIVDGSLAGHRHSKGLAEMQYLSSLPEGSCSEALKAALELEAVTLPSRDGLKAICELPKGVNALTNGDVLITSSTRCLQNPDITVEGEMIASCKIWTMQVVSIMKPKGIILFGRAPATQLFGDEMADGISDYEIRKHSVFGLVLKLPSLASIHRDSLEESQKVFEEFYEKVMI